MKRVYIDMDGVLADFDKRKKQLAVTNPEIVWPQMGYGFFTSLEPMPGAIKSINTIAKHYDTWILTRPSLKNPLCYTEKRVWVEEKLGFDWVKRLILCPNKGLVKGDYLIDDNPWPTFEGQQILFGSEDCPDWTEALKLLGVKSRKP
jgi:5'(3')-deoxyribonucleotidase